MDSITFLSSVLIPLTEKAGEVAQVQDLLDMLEHCFIDAFNMRLPSDLKADGATQATTTSPSFSSSIDAGEEAKLLVVRAVTNFHRSGAARHFAFFQQGDYHPHAALFILELLKSLSGNSQQWFRQLQLDSLEACLAIVEVVGMDNVRRCLPGVVSVGVRYVHRSHHGKDSSKVCLMALKLLRSALVLSFASAEPAMWVQETVTHLTSALRSILEPSALVRGAFGASVIAALESLVTSLLISPGMADHLSSPMGSLLVVAFAVVTNMDHLHHLGDDNATREQAGFCGARNSEIPHTTREAKLIEAAVSSPLAVSAVQDALQYLRGVELLHVATTAVRLPVLRDCLFPLPAPRTVSRASDENAVKETGYFQEASGVESAENIVALTLSVVRKCVRLVGTEMGTEALFTHRRPRKYPAGLVDEFLFSLSGALARLPADVDDGDAEEVQETIGERVTNALLDEHGDILQDWDAYAVHPPVLYVVTRLIIWQFHPSHQLACSAYTKNESVSSKLSMSTLSCTYPLSSELILSGAFEQLWSVVAPPHLWTITEDEDLCNNQQIHHRQVVAATLLRFLTLTAEVLSTEARGAAAEEKKEAVQTQDCVDALERLYALTLYLVLEKATARGVVHEAAMRCLEVYSTASHATDTLAFLLRHSSLIVDETARAVREEHLRPAAASVLRGSLSFLEARMTRTGVTDATSQDARGDGEERGRFFGSSTQVTSVVRQRLSIAAMSAFFQRTGARLATLEEVAQVADFIGSTIHVACDTLYLCSRYDSSTTAEDLSGRRAALALLRDAFDFAAFLNFCVPQEALDEDQERHTTSAHTRVRALQMSTLDAVYKVLQYCTVHDATAPLAVQAVVRGLTCFLTSSAAITWAERARERLHCEEMERRKARRDGVANKRNRKAKKLIESMLDESAADDAQDKEESEEESTESRTGLPKSPPLDWPWTHYVADAAEDCAAAPALSIELPRSHLHTIYRVYLSLFALLREPMAAFATAAAGPGARSGVERRKLAEVAVSPAVFETLNGLESIRLLACDFLLHRMVNEVLPLVILWHERGCNSRIPTHTEERLKMATQQFVAHLAKDCNGAAELERDVATRCRGFPLLLSVAGKAEGLSTSAPGEAEDGDAPLLVPQLAE